MGFPEKTDIELFERINTVLFEHHPDAIYLLDLEGKLIIVNDIVSEISGLPRELLIGNSYEVLIHPDYLEETIGKFMACVAGAAQRYETCIMAKDGVKYLDVTNFPYKVGGRIIAVFGIAKDITALKLRELEYMRSSEILKSRNDDLEKMKAIIAHDLRRPLTNAIGFAKLLGSSALPIERRAEITDFLGKSLQSADTIVRDLNELMSLKTSGNKAVEAIWMEDAISDTIRFYEHDISAVGAAVSLEVEPALELHTVKAYLQSILRNLVGNALKYRSETSKPQLRITASRTDSGVAISVSDNGIGMDLGRVGKDLFKMHKRFAPSAADGSGLGLYLVKEQTQNMGGTVGVESELGVGSTFTVRLPLNLSCEFAI